MLIETYKGIQIMHNANTDEFTTKVVLAKGQGDRKDQFIKGPRLQALRETIDKWLAVSAKKPILKKIWHQNRSDKETYTLADIVVYNHISKEAIIMLDGKQKTVALGNGYRDDKLYISSKENDAIIKLANSKQAVIDKLEEELSCTTGKLIPLKEDHFS